MEQGNTPFGAPPSNPFEAPALAPPPQLGGNPFDTFDASPPPAEMQPQGDANNNIAFQFQPQSAAADPFASQPGQTHHQPPQFQQIQQQPFQQPNYPPYPQTEPHHNAMTSPLVPQQQHYGQQQGYSSTYQQPDAQQGAMVLAQPAGNPFAPVESPVPVDPFAQAMVPVAQQSNQWSSQPAASNASVASLFDPYAVVPAPAPVSPPVAPPAPPLEDPFPAFSFDAHPQNQEHGALVPVTAPQPYAMAPDPAYGQMQPYDPASSHAHDDQYPGRQSTSGGEMVAHRTAENELVPFEEAPPPVSEHVNKYSHILANLAPPDAAPLPRGDKVVKTGFILSRISFRTILLKKWKQSFWVQYGLHTMLWFRNNADFDDWLNNPYHTQQQRNFLVKLAVNFVHDLYKPNVRGYQVTQSRTKMYGKKYLKQFKLERWMDYGPTIAAAFASADESEVDELRRTIVECMRNTPLNDGIRATGAVQEGRELERPRAASFSAGEFPVHDDRTGYPSGGNSHVSDGHAMEDQRHFDSQSAPAGSYQNYQMYGAPQAPYPPQHGQHPPQQQSQYQAHPSYQQQPSQQQSFQY